MQSEQSLEQLKREWKPESHLKGFPSIDVAYIGTRYVNSLVNILYTEHKFNVDVFKTPEEFDVFFKESSLGEIPGIILLEISGKSSEAVGLIENLRQNPLTSGAIIIILASDRKQQLTPVIDKVNDIYYAPHDAGMIAERIHFLVKFKLIKSDNTDANISNLTEYKPPVLSRIFSFSVALILIILFSPLFLITALLIRLESKGPIIYKSKRVGTGYDIFDFYKFRSMVVDADKKLAALSKTNNQYAAEAKNGNQAFVKILNDPRVTKVGSFIRKTSIDELPQLFNVLKGDMMLVGNRPLPLYEAEMLTSDAFAMRFLGPAGITGLWQISKRGKAKMSDQERKELDNHYAKYSSFWMDIKIMLKTIPAVFQKESV